MAKLDAAAVHGAEQLGVQGIQADVQAPKPRIVQTLRLLSKQESVRRAADILDARNALQHSDQIGEAAPHERFAAGQPDFTHAKLGIKAREARDFVP